MFKFQTIKKYMYKFPNTITILYVHISNFIQLIMYVCTRRKLDMIFFWKAVTSKIIIFRSKGKDLVE